MAYSEDHIALAAEYALGTLDADERAQVETMMAVDEDFAAMVAGVGVQARRAEPDGRCGRAAAGSVGSDQDGDRTPKPSRSRHVADPAPSPPDCAAADCGRGRAFRESDCRTRRPQRVDRAQTRNPPSLVRRARRWRNVAAAMTALAAVLVAMIAVQVYKPDLLPAPLRPKPRHPGGRGQDRRRRRVGRAISSRVLQKDGDSPAFILTVDAADQEFHGSPASAPRPNPARAIELWIVSDRLQRPRSLGVIGGSEFTAARCWRPTTPTRQQGDLRGHGRARGRLADRGGDRRRSCSPAS